MTDVKTNHLKGKTGLTRLINACGYSMEGLQAAWVNEAAFRLEVWLAVLLIPLALWLPVPWPSKGLLIAAVLLVMLVELLNSALEAVVDWISTDIHPLAKRAKDIGSAAVMVALWIWAAIWGGTLAPLVMSFLNSR